MTYRRYKIIDLLIWLGLFLALEFVITRAAISWFPGEAYTVSLLLPILLLVMMRWSFYAFIHAVICSAAMVFYLHGTSSWQPYLIYVLGGVGTMSALAFLLPFGKEKVASKWYFSLLYAFIGYVAMELFRSAGAIATTQVGIEIVPQYFLTDALNFVFAALFVLIARRAPGLFCDQKSYLIETEKERRDQEEKAKHAIPDMPEEESEEVEL